MCACGVLRVRKMSRATENVAKSVLLGVVKTAGFFSGSVIKSRAGKKIFKLMPGEVALVSLDAFGELLYFCRSFGTSCGSWFLGDTLLDFALHLLRQDDGLSEAALKHTKASFFY